MNKIAEFTNASDLQPKSVRWMCEDMIQRNTLTILAGEAGVGKTTIIANIAATVSTGGNWQDGSPCTKHSVLIINTEDDFQETILPKLIAAGANTDNIFSYDGRLENGDRSETLSLSDHLTLLVSKIIENPDIKLVIFDPITSPLHDTDQNKHAVIRKLLEDLVHLCSTHEITIIGITHLNKNEQSSASNRILGSIAFRNVARTVLFARATNDSYELALDKGNNAKKRQCFAYTIKSHSFHTEDNELIETSKIEWIGIKDTSESDNSTNITADKHSPVTKATNIIIGMCLENKEGKVKRSEVIDRLSYLTDVSTRSIDRALGDPEVFERVRNGEYILKGCDTAWINEKMDSLNFDV